MTNAQYFGMFGAICLIPVINKAMFGYSFFPRSKEQYLNDTDIKGILRFNYDGSIHVTAFSKGVNFFMNFHTVF